MKWSFLNRSSPKKRILSVSTLIYYDINADSTFIIKKMITSWRWGLSCQSKGLSTKISEILYFIDPSKFEVYFHLNVFHLISLRKMMHLTSFIFFKLKTPLMKVTTVIAVYIFIKLIASCLILRVSNILICQIQMSDYIWFAIEVRKKKRKIFWMFQSLS